MLVYDDANFLFEHSDMCLSADPYTCRQDTRTGDGRFFVIENSPLKQLPPILWILCAVFYHVWNVQGVRSEIVPSIYRCVFMLLIDYINFVS